ncbi:class I SAM-dependent DNA methyltransferase [Streptomyces sp. NPDC058632]|uniref:class I SAM-dependent DNA methyltransferase n=1 Tax=Streptomyces sp. NPDC058632 TaxID=3346567 RepID=UPI00365AC893
MYGADSARFYEAQHTARGKDYRAEAEVVAGEVLRRRPDASSVLDVACGTGGHLAAFGELIGPTEGVDLSEPMLEIARRDHPDVPLHLGDMRDFDLGRIFSAVTCLFASIGYVNGVGELRATLSCLARHTEPDGVVAVEPWWFPETYVDRWVSSDVVRWDGTTVARVAHTVRDGDASRMEVHYLEATPDAGVRHLTEVHRAMLFTREQYEEAFRLAGLEPEYVPKVMSGRGLFVGVRAGRPAQER